ncbi:hypothetical protein [Pleomorphovibrio marinus]|uniref:hypothetical protein n=1 Tax=Pleomorphovibrio marinus TaxID=2164132 RepID=UPI000E0BA82E|nr:hypothetical protein [Pleomorphovibrio marinus]
MERKFKFVGNPDNYVWDNPPVKGKVYDGDFRWSFEGQTGPPLESWVTRKELICSEEWEEITEPEEVIHNRVSYSKILNQDMPASSMTKFEMAVLGNVREIVGLKTHATLPDRAIVEDAIELAKETFKQLEDEKTRH